MLLKAVLLFWCVDGLKAKGRTYFLSFSVGGTTFGKLD